MTKPKRLQSDLELERNTLRAWENKLTRREKRLRNREARLFKLLDTVRAERDRELEPVQLKLIPDLTDPELVVLRRTLERLRESGHDNAPFVLAAALNAVERINRQVLEELKREGVRAA